ncbi:MULTISPECIES: hypothetical protein [Weeksella]|uniref:hypothetical protein n=1 Tax=Weeksella TaxID=1013 RepID=UPI00114D30F4|nr:MULTISPECIES: hypothetical protein [Weeksella]MDK7374234.1 hypothetical protein [Weeksella virosa]
MSVIYYGIIMESFDIENFKSGYIAIQPTYGFDFYHHHCISFSKKIGGFGMNLSPLGEPLVVPIRGFQLTEKGYEFHCNGERYSGEDNSLLESKLTKNLIQIVNAFTFTEKSKTNISIEYTSDFLVALRMSTYLPSEEPQFFKLIRAENGNLYSGQFPLSETEAVFVHNVSIENDKIIVNINTDSEIVYPFFLQPEIQRILKCFFS